MSESLKFEFRDLSHEELIRYAEFLLIHYRLVDAYWFLKVEDFLGLDVATRLNEEIWAKLGEVSAIDIMKYMGIEKGGLKEVLQALKYFPWTVIASWKIVQLTDRRAVVLAEICPPQVARTKNNRKIFACKSMEQKCLENFAKMFNHHIKVKCHYAPPDAKPPDHWCRWEFTLE